jgi:hypothetical protein
MIRGSPSARHRAQTPGCAGPFVADHRFSVASTRFSSSLMAR